MYKGKSLWDEEQDRYEIESQEKEKSQEYQNQENYNSGGKASDVYNSEISEEKKEEEAKGIE